MIENELKKRLAGMGLDSRLLNNDFAMNKIAIWIGEVESSLSVGENSNYQIGEDGKLYIKIEKINRWGEDRYKETSETTKRTISIDSNGMVKEDYDYKYRETGAQKRLQYEHSNDVESGSFSVKQSEYFTPEGVEMKLEKESVGYSANQFGFGITDKTNITMERNPNLVTARISQTGTKFRMPMDIFVPSEHPETFGNAPSDLSQIPDYGSARDREGNKRTDEINRRIGDILKYQPDNPLAKMILERETEKGVSAQDLCDIYNITSPEATRKVMQELDGLQRGRESQAKQSEQGDRE